MYNKTISIILEGLKSKIISNKGLTVFLDKNAKFENWLQVELCGILTHKLKKHEIKPEQYSRENRCSYDIGSKEDIFELKIFTTRKSPSSDTKYIIHDIKKLLQANDDREKIVIVFAFPLKHNSEEWKKYWKKINSERMFNYYYRNINFKGIDKNGILYLIPIKN